MQGPHEMAKGRIALLGDAAHEHDFDREAAQDRDVDEEVAEVFIGHDGADLLNGEDGNDLIHAGDGNDWVGVWNDWGEAPVFSRSGNRNNIGDVWVVATYAPGGEAADETWRAHRLSLGVPEGHEELGDILIR